MVLNRKLLLFSVVFIILGISLITAGILITKEKPTCQDGMCLPKKVDLSVEVVDGDILINGKLRVSDNIESDYEIKNKKKDKYYEKIRYIQEIDKKAEDTELITSYSKKPNYVYNKYHFMFYKDYEDYCKGFKDCLAFDKYTYQILAYDGYQINTKRIDEVTGEIYPTTYSEGVLKTEIQNTKTSVSFNDVVLSAGEIWINGNDVQWINYTRFLHDVAPQCYYENASGIIEENMSAIITPCFLILNHSSSVSWEKASLTFDMDVIPSDAIKMGNKSLFNLSSFNLGFSSSKTDALASMNALDDNLEACRPEDAIGVSILYSPNCGEVIWDNVNINSYGEISANTLYIMNGTFTDVKFSISQMGSAGKMSNVNFDNLQIIDSPVFGGAFNGNNLRVKVGNGACFNPVLQDLKIDLVGGYFECLDYFGTTVLASMQINITDQDFISTKDINNAFNGAWDFYLKTNISMMFRGDNCTDEVDVNVTMVDTQGTSYNDQTTNYGKVVDVYYSNSTDIVDFNPFTFNLTNSSYFPVTDFKYNFTETNQKGVWKMYEIPYEITQNPWSDSSITF